MTIREELALVRAILKQKLSTLSRRRLIELIMSIDNIEEILEEYLTVGDNDPQDEELPDCGVSQEVHQLPTDIVTRRECTLNCYYNINRQCMISCFDPDPEPMQCLQDAVQDLEREIEGEKESE